MKKGFSHQPEIGIRSLPIDEALERIGQGLWNFNAINLVTAHELSRGEGVNIAVIDSGVDYNHSYLKHAYAGGTDVVADSDPNDTDDHGTFVAGIIAGKDVGVAPESRIYSVKVQESDEGDYKNLNLGIEWCINNDKGVKVDLINVSLGSPEFWGQFQLMCSNAVKKGIPIVAAAGNNFTGAFFPSSNPDVVSVAAVEDNGIYFAHCEYSNLWPTVDISAPGKDIVSLQNGGGYCLGGGTSSAAPHVTGVLALGLSLLKKSGKDIEPGKLAGYLSKYLKKTALKLRDDDETQYLADRYDPGRTILRGKRKLSRCLFGVGLVQADKFLRALL